MSKFNAKKSLARLKELDLELENVIKDKQDCTLIDYVKWVGRFDFNELPLSDADVLVMCVLSYFEYTRAFESAAEILLKDTLWMNKAGIVKLMITGGDMGNTNIYRAACESKRFGELLIKDYVNIASTEPPVQFSAMTFSAPGIFNMICYRGTDSTVAGWKENFMISFTRTKAQELAEKYAEEHIKKGEKWYVSGHSKGGNLALCAALSLTEEKSALVDHIYLLDGPGLCPEVAEDEAIKNIDAKTTRVIPEFDVIGKLFEPKITDTKIVRSFRKGINQHSLASWMVDHGELSTVPQNAPGCMVINDLVDNWIRSIDLERRKQFVNELFDSMSVDGVTDLADITPEYYGKVVVELIGKSRDTKKILGELPKKLFLDGVFDEIESQKNMYSQRQFDVLFAAGLFVFGLATMLISAKLFEIVSLLIVSVIILFQLFVLIRRIIKQKRVNENSRLRIIMLIGTVGILLFLLLRPGALSVLGSVIIGLIFTVFAYVSFERIALSKTVFLRVFSVIEAVLASILALVFFIVPQEYVGIAALIAGGIVITDAVLRIVLVIYSLIKERAHGK